MIDEVGTIWVVEYPRPLSSGTYDILWHASVTDFLIRGLGGLRKEDIYSIYKSKAKAEQIANKLMKEHEPEHDKFGFTEQQKERWFTSGLD